MTIVNRVAPQVTQTVNSAGFAPCCRLIQWRAHRWLVVAPFLFVAGCIFTAAPHADVAEAEQFVESARALAATPADQLAASDREHVEFLRRCVLGHYEDQARMDSMLAGTGIPSMADFGGMFSMSDLILLPALIALTDDQGGADAGERIDPQQAALLRAAIYAHAVDCGYFDFTQAAKLSDAYFGTLLAWSWLTTADRLTGQGVGAVMAALGTTEPGVVSTPAQPGGNTTSALDEQLATTPQFPSPAAGRQQPEEAEIARQMPRVERAMESCLHGQRRSVSFQVTVNGATGSVSDFTVQNATADLPMDCFREAVDSLRFQPFEQLTFSFDWRLE